MKSLLAAMIVCSGFAFFSEAKAGTLKDEYELQERCGIRTEAWFKKEYGKDGITQREGGFDVATYTNHYNLKMNKCLVLYKSVSHTYKKNEKSLDLNSEMTTLILFDINEQKEYGGYFAVGAYSNDCNVDNKKCHTEDEFNALAKPYMEK